MSENQEQKIYTPREAVQKLSISITMLHYLRNNRCIEGHLCVIPLSIPKSNYKEPIYRHEKAVQSPETKDKTAKIRSVYNDRGDLPYINQVGVP